MRKTKIRGILVDAYNNTIEPREIEDDLENYYNALKCDTINIITRVFDNNLRVCIVCDDNGKLKKKQIPSAIDFRFDDILVGNLFITGAADHEGNLTNLNDTKIKRIMEHVTVIEDRKYMLIC